MVDDYFALLKKIKTTKDDFKELSKKFKELRSLAINYKDEKELEIDKLTKELNNLKTMAEDSKIAYEAILDKTTESIEKFISAAESEKNAL